MERQTLLLGPFTNAIERRMSMWSWTYRVSPCIQCVARTASLNLPASSAGDTPNNRALSRLNCDGLSYPTRYHRAGRIHPLDHHQPPCLLHP